jgi:hypothetical protein
MPDRTETDWRGTEYGVGSRVLYPRQYADTLLMQEGTVLEFVQRTEQDWDEDWKPIRVPVDGFKVKVRPIRASRYERVGVTPDRPVIIDIVENLTALP